MTRLVDLEQLPADLRGGAVTIGNFDGVHRGHARIVEQLVTAARTAAGPALVFTFDPHPAQLLRPERVPPLLTQLPRRAELLAELGVDAIVVCRTRPELLALEPGEFFQSVLVERLGARAVVEGANFLFGRGRAGDIRRLVQLCRSAGLTLDVVEGVRIDGQEVSSSRVRELLVAGQIAAANRLLTQPYRLAGRVGSGARRGAQLGFPTANLHEIATLVPGPGVYAGATLVEGRAWPVALNIGGNPTFAETAVKVEAHLPGFAGDLYGQVLAIDILDRLRDIQPFPAVELLVQQLHRDVAEACRRFAESRAAGHTRSHHGA